MVRFFKVFLLVGTLFPLTGCAEESTDTILDVGLGYRVVLEGIPLRSLETADCASPLTMTMQTETAHVLKAFESRRGPTTVLLRPANHLMKICGRRNAKKHRFNLVIQQGKEQLGSVSFTADYARVNVNSTDFAVPDLKSDPAPHLESFYDGYPLGAVDKETLTSRSADAQAEYTSALALSLKTPTGFIQPIVGNDPYRMVGIQIDQKMLDLAIAQGHPIAPTLRARLILAKLHSSWRDRLAQLPEEDKLQLLYGAAMGELRGAYAGVRLGDQLRNNNLPIDAAKAWLADKGQDATPEDLISILNATPALTDTAVSKTLNRTMYIEGCTKGMLTRRAGSNDDPMAQLSAQIPAYKATETACNVNFPMYSVSFNVIPRIEADCDGSDGRYQCTVKYRDNCHAFSNMSGTMGAAAKANADIVNKTMCQVVSSFTHTAIFNIGWSGSEWVITDLVLPE